jgi:hypothetical protein
MGSPAGLCFCCRTYSSTCTSTVPLHFSTIPHFSIYVFIDTSSPSPHPPAIHSRIKSSTTLRTRPKHSNLLKIFLFSFSQLTGYQLPLISPTSANHLSYTPPYNSTALSTFTRVILASVPHHDGHRKTSKKKATFILSTRKYFGYELGGQM